MLSFEEFVLKEAPKKIPDQQMGYDDKKKIDDLHFVLSNGKVVGSFNGLNIYQSKVGDLIIVGCIFNNKVIYSSDFKRIDGNTVQQSAVWRDKSDELRDKTEGVIKHVIFNIILKKYSLLSGCSQTRHGNMLWTKTLLPTALSKKFKCCVVNLKDKSEFGINDLADVDGHNNAVYTDKESYTQLVYKIYKR